MDCVCVSVEELLVQQFSIAFPFSGTDGKRWRNRREGKQVWGGTSRTLIWAASWYSVELDRVVGQAINNRTPPSTARTPTPLCFDSMGRLSAADRQTNFTPVSWAVRCERLRTAFGLFWRRWSEGFPVSFIDYKIGRNKKKFMFSRTSTVHEIVNMFTKPWYLFMVAISLAFQNLSTPIPTPGPQMPTLRTLTPTPTSSLTPQPNCKVIVQTQTIPKPSHRPCPNWLSSWCRRARPSVTGHQQQLLPGSMSWLWQEWE